MTEYGLILVTVSSEEEGKAIATYLLEHQLAACVTLIPVESMYIWEDKLNCDREYQLIIKTKLQIFAEISQKIQELHSYDLPEIIALPIVQGSPSYLNWIGNRVKFPS